jgi:hypothetical protein
MGRHKSAAEDLVEIASYLPWWVSLAIAAVAWFVLGAYAGSQVSVTPGDPLASVTGAAPRAFARIGQFLFSITFLIGAVISLGRRLRNGRLLRGVARHPFDASLRYHGLPRDPAARVTGVSAETCSPWDGAGCVVRTVRHAPMINHILDYEDYH